MKTLVYEFSGERGQGIGQALFCGMPFAYALAKESARELKLRVRAGQRPLEYYLGDKTGWSRDLPPPGASTVLEFWNFGATATEEAIEAAVHSAAPVITIRGNNLRAEDHAIRGSYFFELFDLPDQRELQPDVVVHLRTGDRHAFGIGKWRDRDIREVVWMSGGVENAGRIALNLAMSLAREQGCGEQPLIMFLSDSARARRWAVGQDLPARVVTTGFDVRHSYRGSEADFRLLWQDLTYMMKAPILIHTAGAFSQFAAAANPGICVPVERHIPNPRSRPWFEVRWARGWALLRRLRGR